MLCVRDYRRQMYIELTAGNTYFAHDVQTINRYCASAAMKKKGITYEERVKRVGDL